MPRSVGQVNHRTIEFAKTYDRLVKKYGCPVEAAFKMAFKGRKIATREKMLQLLITQRFPKFAAVHVQTDGPTQMSLAWETTDGAIETLPDESVVKQIEALDSESSDT